MFCSKECMAAAQESYMKNGKKIGCHNLEQRMMFKCLSVFGGDINKLKQMMEDPELSQKTVFDFDFSNPDDYHFLLAINSMSLEMNFGPNLVPYAAYHPALQLFNSLEGKAVGIACLMKFYRVLSLNLFGIGSAIPSTHPLLSRQFIKLKNIANGLFVFGSRLKHSCAANIDRVSVDGKVAYVVKLPVAKGEQLFINYG